MVEDFEIKAVEIPMSFEKKIRTEDGDKDLFECMAEVMNDIKKIKKGVL